MPETHTNIENNAPDSQKRSALRIFRREAPVTVLGPGKRAVIWVQGCPFACHGCIVTESWDDEGGYEIPITDLADWILAQEDLAGVTFSGGEPMAQAGGLTLLIEQLRMRADLGVVCYTGYTLEFLQRQGSAEQQAFLACIDLLIDGVYVESRHADLRWRGSANQRLLPLSPRYRDEVEAILASTEGSRDNTAGLEFFMNDVGAFGFAGVPANPRFRVEFEARLASLGIAFTPP